jgi:peptidoglycan-associated lipoprotein
MCNDFRRMLQQYTTATNTLETVTPSGTTAKQTKETSSTMAKQTNKTASTTINQPAMEQMKSDLDTIYFDFDSASLSDQSRKTLNSNANYLKKHSDVSIRIEGNCDERGSAEYNIALGEKRAKAALKYLSTLGTDDGRLSIVSYGKEKPIEQGHDESAWTKNRRDEFVITSK